jgi:shikimate dehydrogenase
MDQLTENSRGEHRELDLTARFLTGLVGEGISSSRSPWLHEREADAQGVRLIYSLFDLAGHAGGGDELAATLEAAKRMHFAGLNVTHPYKQRVIPLLDCLSDEARRIGAVNTVAIRNGRLVGYNTDYSGFAEGLRRGLAGARFSTVVQLGAGGAGSATARALLNQGTGTLLLYDVDQQRARLLADSLGASFDPARVRVVDDLRPELDRADGVVNASPVGMTGHPGSPIPTGLLRPSLWVADIVYFPLQTALLKEARAVGCLTLDGVTMVVFQAAAAFDLFTGLTADRERMLAGARGHWAD